MRRAESASWAQGRSSGSPRANNSFHVGFVCMHSLGADRLPRPRDDVLRRGVRFRLQVLDLGPGKRRDIDANGLRVLEELLVMHGGVKGGAQRAELLCR